MVNRIFLAALVSIPALALIFAREKISELVNSIISKPHSGCDKDSNEFDYMLLVMQWPPSDGKMDLDHWTLHGLWPSRNGADSGSYPCECSAVKYDPSELSDLEPKLRKYWPSLFGGNDHFWSHEWVKHGTCAKLQNEHDYFEKTLALRDAFDPLPALSKSGIVPSKETTYTTVEISDALKNAFGDVPLLGCKNYKGHQELHEVGMCFSSPVPSGYEECDATTVGKHTGEVNDCDSNKPVYFPGQSPESSQVE